MIIAIENINSTVKALAPGFFAEIWLHLLVGQAGAFSVESVTTFFIYLSINGPIWYIYILY